MMSPLYVVDNRENICYLQLYSNTVKSNLMFVALLTDWRQSRVQYMYSFMCVTLSTVE